jgi:molybdenum cofactor biosynthesis enzyme
MLKAIDREMMIGDIHMTSKSGGKSGDWKAP